MRRFLAITATWALLSGTSPALPQGADAGDPPSRDRLGDGTAITAAKNDAQDARTALSREIARMKAEVAGLERLMSWQADLTRIARTDRAEALRQRLPMADCRASALAPICDELTGLFRPEEGSGNAVAAQHGSEGEGAK